MGTKIMRVNTDLRTESLHKFSETTNGFSNRS